ILIGRRQEEPNNLSVQKEILDVLCQLVSINENQKLVVAKLREERGRKRPLCFDDKDQNEVHSTSNELDDGDFQHPDGRNSTLSPSLPSAKSPESVDQNVCSAGQVVRSLPISFQEYRTERPNSLRTSPEQPLNCSVTGEGFGTSDPSSPQSWWCSPEKRLHNFQPPTADYSVEDVHDLVSEDEFMHALGLLTVSECHEVLAKRYERRKHSAYAHVFSSTIWEKPETRRKRRAWLTSGAGSPPNLRRKVRPLSQPPSRPESRPVSPAQSSCSPPTTYLPSQPTSPQSLEEDFPLSAQSSEEICPMCNVKGADIQCDGCGVMYHSHCVDLEDSYPPPSWLCLTCEQLGIRASTSIDPQHDSRRREALEVREHLLRQRAELTVAKLQLEERKHHLAVALEAQQLERKSLQRKEDDVRRAIHQLHNFIYTFQRPESPKTPKPSIEEPENLCSADLSAASLRHSNTSDTALPPYSPSDQNSPVSSDDQPPLKSATSKLLYSCTPIIDSTELPHVSAHTSCSPDSSPSHRSQTHVPKMIVPLHSASPDQLPDSTSDQPGSPESTSAKSTSPEPRPAHQFSSLHCSEESVDLDTGPTQHPRRLTMSKCGSVDPKIKSSLSHQMAPMNPQPTDLSTSSHSRQNGLPRMRRGESKSVTSSI
ncbi:uncharacterized protein, partial [Palaemon carinicauda]|uniref:uncharacterized protein n=1 Tax=Palaemon carinicauda TaxID=392227 RepID=UPI0035B65D24